MSVHRYQKDGKVYYRCIYRVHGKQRQRRGFTTKLEARKFERDALTAAENKVTLANPRLTVGEYLEDWYAGIEGTKQIGASQVQRIGQHLKHLISNLGRMKIKDLDKSHVVQLRKKLEKTHSARTIKQMEIVLKSAIADGVDDEKIARNKLHRFKTMAVPFSDKQKVEPFQPQEQTALLEAAKEYSNQSDPKWHLLIYLALHTGMRRGELYALQWRHIDLDDKYIQVEQSMEYSNGENSGQLKEPKSTAGIRTIYITAKCCAEIRKYQLWARETGLKFRKSIKENDFVFFKDNFQPLNKNVFRSRWTTILKNSGVRLISPRGETRRFHDLRHSHASNMIHAGLNIKLLQERMGHSSASITLDVYSHIFKQEGEKQYQEALSKWEAAL